MNWRRIDDSAQAFCERRLGWERCTHWRANLALVILSAVAVALTMRFMLGALLLVVPLDSWAGNFVLNAWMIGDGLFYSSAFVSTFGGATSLMRELRADRAAFSIVGAIGHMFSAQFAGLMTLIGCMYVAVPPLLSLLACGMAGWAGNAWLVRLDKWTSSRVFPGGE